MNKSISQKIGSLFVLSFFLSACGNHVQSATYAGAPQSCPTSLLIPYHQVTIHTTDVAPSKMAVLLEGQLKYDECLAQPVIAPPPIVHARKQTGSIALTVQHFGAYKTLPSEISFEILDRGDCSKTPTSYFKAEQVPLDFKTDYPNGKSCGGSLNAKAELNK